MPELFIGLMSGTSLDGIDAALVEFADGHIHLLDFFYQPYEAALRDALGALCDGGAPLRLGDYGEMDCRLGRAFADAANALLANNRLAASQISAIGSHGQTVCHGPGGALPFSLQIGDPNIIAERTGITTVADFRRRDIACGGQGAPLVPAFHHALFGQPGRDRCVVNLGGIANITVLPAAAAVTGFDSGPGNTLMDGWTRRHLQRGYDANGDWARTGQVDQRLLASLSQDGYFKLPPPKSTGTDYFCADWLHRHLRGNHRPPADIQATLCQLTATTVADAIRRHAPATAEVLLCGGGVHNGRLVEQLAQQLDCPVLSTAAYHVDPDHVEAMAFAWLARQTLGGLPGNLKAVTGAHKPAVLGGIYPANGG